MSFSRGGGAYAQCSIFSRAKPHFLRGDLKDCLEADDASAAVFTGTKVVATLGPSCQDVETLSEMMKAGMVGARIDLTWGSLDFHKASLEALQEASKASRKLCCTMVDTQGREIMIRRPVTIDDKGWAIHDEGITIKAGQTIVVSTRTDVVASDTVLPVMYDGFNQMCEPGDTLYIGRYLVCGADSASLYLDVVDVEGTEVVCVAKNDALLEGLLTVFHIERSSGTVENVQNNLPLLSDHDKACLESLSKDFDLDFITLSYTRDAQDVREARAYLDSIGMNSTKIIAKVATRQALIDFLGIMELADGIIISRGTLGLDCLPEKMATIQKTLIKACNLVGKPVMLTRVVDTMINTPRPTRAEATDIANAVLDGVDGFLLGAETLRGKYPVMTVSTITSISRSAEKVFDHQYHYEHLMELAADLSIRGAKNGQAPESDGEGDLSHQGSGMHSPRVGSMVSLQDLQELASVTSSGGTSFKRVGFTDPAAPHPPSRLSQSALQKVRSVGNAMQLGAAANAMAQYGMDSDSTNDLKSMGQSDAKRIVNKLEAICSSAVRCADKVKASLIVVYTHTGDTAQLVAKYRPPMPILTLVVPHLVSDKIHWRLEGRSNARQCLLTRGLMPMLSAPGHNGDTMLQEAIRAAAKMGIVKAHDHVVCVQRIHAEYCVKVLSVDGMGSGIMKLSRTCSNAPQQQTAESGNPWDDNWRNQPMGLVSSLSYMSPSAASAAVNRSAFEAFKAEVIDQLDATHQGRTLSEVGSPPNLNGMANFEAFKAEVVDLMDAALSSELGSPPNVRGMLATRARDSDEEEMEERLEDE